jgi:hypothetical protein
MGEPRQRPQERLSRPEIHDQWKVHFGWARVIITTSAKTFTATLTGYAYDTIPNKSIIEKRNCILLSRN